MKISDEVEQVYGHNGRLETGQLLRTNYLESSTGSSIFLGPKSDSPLLLDCHLSGSQASLEPRTYIFANLFVPEVSLSDVGGSLPKDSDIVR